MLLITIEKRYYDPSSLEWYSAESIEEVKEIVNHYNKHKYKFQISSDNEDDHLKLVELSYELDELNIPHAINGSIFF